MPGALALTWKIVKDKKLDIKNKKALLLDFDEVLGLNLAKIRKPKIPQKIKKLVELREKYRQEKKWAKADEIRKKIKESGYQVEDTKGGPEIKIFL